MKRASVITLGCKVNMYESMALKEQLEAEGIAVVPADEHADLYIINSCSVTNRTDHETRKMIRRAKKQSPDSTVVVTGCYAQIKAAELAAMPEVDYVIDNTKKGELVKSVLTAAGSDAAHLIISDIGSETDFLNLNVSDFKGRNRAFLKIQDGCDSFCAYCIVPYARGSVRSMSQKDVLAAIERFVDAGFKEVVLSGIHIGKYGADLEGSPTLLSLIKEIERSSDLRRLRLSSIEPNEIDDAFIDHMSGSKIVCNHLHIPLQSGDDTILKKMHRTYTTDSFSSLIERLKASVAGITIGADIIVGFPGESDTEFLRTYDFVKGSKIDYLHVFKYSKRDGTAACDMPGHLDEHVKKGRAKKLRELGSLKRAAAYKRSAGKAVRVLFEKSANKDTAQLKGLTRNYLNAAIKDFRSDMFNEEFEFQVKEVIDSDNNPTLLL